MDEKRQTENDRFVEKLAFYSRDFTKDQKIKLINFLSYKKWEAIKMYTDTTIELIKNESES